MTDEGYSTVMDALLFLSMVSICALILSPALVSSAEQQAEAGYGMRATAAASLASLQGTKADRFEYRLLGDAADTIAGSAGVDTEAWLYKSVTGAVLGRGQRHKTIIGIAAENAACQFILNGIRLDPLTGDFDAETCSLIDDTLRRQIDDRFSYSFIIRWTPLADVPFGGSVMAGEVPPAKAASSGCFVTMPYHTSFNRTLLEDKMKPELDRIMAMIATRQAGVNDDDFNDELRALLGACMDKTTGYAADDLWKVTLGRKLDSVDPYAPLKSFGGNDTAVTLENPVPGLIAAYSGPALDGLYTEIVTGVDEGRLSGADARELTLDWMLSRYTPSRATAYLFVWVDNDASR